MNLDLARERLSQLFNFFKAVEDRRTPRVCLIKEQPWLVWLHDLPEHETLKLHKPAPESGEWLTVKKPNLSPCPPIPDTLQGWIDDGWDDPENELPTPVPERIIQHGNTPVPERFDASADRVALFTDWSDKRSRWRTLELPGRMVANIWDRLFSLRNDLARDSESFELMVGDGILSCKGSQGRIFHPIVLRKVEQAFDPVKLEFKIIDTEAPPELYSPVFADDDFAGLRLKDLQQSLEFEDIHPLDDEKLDHWLRGLAGIIKDGAFVPQLPEEAAQQVQIGRGPVLFLRARSSGRSQFIDEIRGHIPIAEEYPSSLLTVVGIFPPNTQDDEAHEDGTYANEQEDALLTKPANAEQVQILRKLKRRDGILVQGPPGTGKTHTIANLIGSFLAEGKSVLVTSHSHKALRVLREKVAEPLRNLCVSVLDSDAQSRRERETAIREFAARLADSRSKYEREAERLRCRRIELLVALKRARANMLQLVGSEYVPIVLCGNEIDPSMAAREVAKGVGQHDWIPGPIDPSAPIPLSDTEVRLLYEIECRISPEDEFELSGPLPELDALPSEDLFSAWVREYNDLRQSDLTHRNEWWATPNQEPSPLDALLEDVSNLVQYLRELEGADWKLSAIQAGMELGPTSEIWLLMCEDIRDVRNMAQEASKSFYEHGPKLASALPLEDQLRTLQEIDSHLKTNRKISWVKRSFSPTWDKCLKSWKVGSNREPATSDEFLALRKCVELTVARNRLSDRWARVMLPLGVGPLDGSAVAPEEYAFQFVPQIQALIKWHETRWAPVQTALIGQGLNWEAVLAEAPASNTIHHVAARLCHVVQTVLPDVLAACRT